MNAIHTIPDLSKHVVGGKISVAGIKTFKAEIYAYYGNFKRMFPWRQTTDPYAIIVSEIMLQQTQADRVVGKYNEFLRVFPTMHDLAHAPLKDVLSAWIGLGYNRRALSLQALAQRMVAEYSGVVPNDPTILVTFKGIGPNTAGSICAFAFNRPTVFIETNIRSVMIHLFFRDAPVVADSDIIPLIEQVNDSENARHWYYALMDYGVMLKKQFKNPSRKSTHHARQSKFEGSDRQIRGKILKMLVEYTALTFEQMHSELQEDPRFAAILLDLLREKLVERRGAVFILPS